MTTNFKIMEILRFVNCGVKALPALIPALFLGVILSLVPGNQAHAGSPAREQNDQEVKIHSINGFYAGYFRAIAGEGYAMFLFHDGRIAGVDIGGVRFDGTYEITEDEAIVGRLNIGVPAGIPLIFGIDSPGSGLKFKIRLKTTIEEIRTREFSVLSPLGPVWIRLVRTGDI